MATLTVDFVGPVDEGCGSPKEFKVIVDGVSNTVPHTAPGASYSVPYNLEVGKSGLVEVYLITGDTNSSDNKNGASVTTPYIATDLVLNSVNYQVYVAPVGSQDMNLSWNDQVVGVGDWQLDTNGYQVFYKVNGGSEIPYETTSNLTKVFNTVTNSVAVCGNNISFLVKATLKNGGVTYVATSNVESISIFRFASVPTDVRVLWSEASADFSTMDIRAVFKNPSDNGCGSIAHFVVNVLDNNNNLISGATKNIMYVEGTEPYSVNFNDVIIPASKTGYIQVYMVTNDINNERQLNSAAELAAYTADRLPIINNIVINEIRTLLNFEVITATSLVLVNNAITLINSAPEQFLWNSDGSTPGVAVIRDILENSEIRYRVTIDPSVQLCPFPSPLPSKLLLIVSNTGAGLTYYNVDATF